MASILITDDDPTVRMIARELLRQGDHAIVEAADGSLALQVIQRVPVDLIILNLLMPNCDGLEVIRTIRRFRPRIRILAISSGARAGALSYLEAARVLGADEVMSKPLRIASFAGTVDRLLRAPAPQQQQSWAMAG